MYDFSGFQSKFDRARKRAKDGEVFAVKTPSGEWIAYLAVGQLGSEPLTERDSKQAAIAAGNVMMTERKVS